MNPGWADELKRRYLRGESSQFVLHGNVHDLVLHDDKLHDIVDYLGNELLAPSKDVVLEYNLSSGVRFLKKDATIDGLEELFLPRSADKVLPALEKLLLTTNRVAVIISYAEMIAPAADVSFSTEADRQSVIALHRWSLSPILEKSDNVVVLLTENLSELHGKLVGNPRTVTLQIGMPDEEARNAVIAHVAPGTDAKWKQRLAEVTAGLKAVQLKALLEPHAEIPDDPAAVAAREKYIVTLLANAPNAATRAKKLAALTAGMSNDDIRDLVAPGSTAAANANDEHEQLLRLIYKRKREIIERECFGLLEFVESNHDFSVVGGIEEAKRELLSIASNMREGRTNRCPMGLLFTGPMGTGKTFVAEAFVRETGLTAVKLGNFRSKWVGATEGNLDRVLSVIRAIGQIIVIIDEGDRAFGGGDGETDGGTSSRVIARIKEFMSDTSNRGRVMFILMTNRP
jgi:transitional endoplasmic reticulum ATPase